VILNETRWDYLLFSQTPLFVCCSEVFLAFWIVGVVICGGKYIRDVNSLKKKFSNACLIDGVTYDVFCDVCDRLDISIGKVELIFDYTCGSPCTGGFLKGYVILPNLDYTTEQLEVIFLHELTHYRQKNHIMRHLTELVFVIHFFNPFIWFYKEQIRFWGEYTCDYEVISKTKGVDFYFHTIDMIAKNPKKIDSLGAYLYENKTELMKRRELMERSYQRKMKTKLLSTFIVFTMVLTSTFAVEAATEAVADEYCDLFWDTAEYIEVENDYVELEEHFLEGFEEGVIVEEWDGPDVMLLSNSVTYDWTLAGNTAKLGQSFYASAGSHVNINAVDTNTSGNRYRIGLKGPGSSLVYVDGTGNISHTFDISVSGNYQVFVQNTTGNAIDVTVMMIVY